MADLVLTRQTGATRATLSWEELSVSEHPPGRLTLALGPHRAPLPRRVGEVAATRGVQVAALAPDRWLAIEETAAGQEPPALSPGLARHDVTDAYARVRIAGPLADALLAAATGIDLAPFAFPVGDARLTEFAKTRAILLRPAADVFEVLFDASLADYVWEWATVNGGLVASA